MMKFSRTRPPGTSPARLAGLTALAAGLTILVLGGYLYWNNFQARQALANAAEQVEIQARRIEQRVRSIREALTSEGFTELARSVANGQGDRDQLIAALRKRNVRNVLNVVIATEAVEEIDLAAFPGGGFAALEMILRARTEGSVPAQVHFAGTPDEYLAMAERLDRLESIDAVALVTFPVSVLANRMSLPEGVDAMRLMQTNDASATSLQEMGRSRAANQFTVDIEGTLLQLAWERSTVIGSMSPLQLYGVMGIGALAALLGLLLMRRASAPPTRTDAAVEDAGPRESTETAADEDERGDAKPRPARPPYGDRRETGQDRDDPWAAQAEHDVEPAPGHRPDADDRSTEPAPEPDEPLTADGELRRPVVEQRDIEAPELGKSPQFRSAETDSASADRDDNLFFEPDAPADDQSEISQMLKSLIEEEAEDDDMENRNTRDHAQSPPGEGEPRETGSSGAEPAMPPKSIFRAYDIRGVVGDTISRDIAESIGRAIGSEARHRGLNRIAIARDGRLSGAELLAALSRGLTDTGLEVIDVGAVPTPVLYYAAQELGGGSGVMVTGSHNPPDYNGFKIVLGGETLSGDDITALYQRLESGDLVAGHGQVQERRITTRYVERISTDVQLERPLKVVADCGNGIAGSIAPRLLEAIGADVIPLYAEVDGTFPNHHPDPSDPKTLEDLKLCVRNFNADLGVAFDGDGDRLGVVAPNGDIIYADRLMMLFARDVLSRNSGAPIIFDVKCSSLLPREIEKAGGKPIMARTGHSFIKQRLKLEQAPLAGEMSGHFFFGERWFGFDDGLYAAARLLEILAADTRSASQILAALPRAESTPELNVQMKEGQPHAFVEAFQQSVRFEDAEISTLDGLRADFSDGFGLVRASNTTPVLVLRFEGRDKKALARIQEAFREAMLEVDPALRLPF